MWIDGLQKQFSSAPFENERILLVQQVPPSKPISPTLINGNLDNYFFNINSDPDRNQLIEKESSSLSRFQNLTLLDPAKSICPKGSCVIAENGQTLYSDEFHLSPIGALRLKDQIVNALTKILSIP
jgi:hypothetical protein